MSNQVKFIKLKCNSDQYRQYREEGNMNENAKDSFVLADISDQNSYIYTFNYCDNNGYLNELSYNPFTLVNDSITGLMEIYNNIIEYGDHEWINSYNDLREKLNYYESKITEYELKFNRIISYLGLQLESENNSSGEDPNNSTEEPSDPNINNEEPVEDNQAVNTYSLTILNPDPNNPEITNMLGTISYNYLGNYNGSIETIPENEQIKLIVNKGIRWNTLGGYLIVNNNEVEIDEENSYTFSIITNTVAELGTTPLNSDSTNPLGEENP